jgi:hypothetical protein
VSLVAYEYDHDAHGNIAGAGADVAHRGHPDAHCGSGACKRRKADAAFCLAHRAGGWIVGVGVAWRPQRPLSSGLVRRGFCATYNVREVC